VEGFEKIPHDGHLLAVQSSGIGKPLIYAHGLTGNRIQVARQWQPAADKIYLITFDQRGHGDSNPVLDPQAYEPNLAATDFGAIMNYLGVERAAVGGTSMGAAVAILFALAYPERVERLILVAPAFGDAPNPGKEALKTMGRDLINLGIEEYITRCKGQEWLQMGLSQEAMAFKETILRSHSIPSIGIACQSVADWIIAEDLSQFSKINVPVIIIAWQNDEVHPFSLAQRLCDVLPKAQLLVSSQYQYQNDLEHIGRICKWFL
jgi:pimeloyl-ACP methyl ester carboxylesterase